MMNQSHLHQVKELYLHFQASFRYTVMAACHQTKLSNTNSNYYYTVISLPILLMEILYSLCTCHKSSEDAVMLNRIL